MEEYQVFLQPVLFPTLSIFCMELTSITQEQVDQGISFPNAIQALRKLSLHIKPFFVRGNIMIGNN
jgi:inhibitor of KinA sporulation pathway (predicted exonuclease)